MKKGFILGVAALAAATTLPLSADAAEVKFGGYYRVQGYSEDVTPSDESKVQADGSYDSGDDIQYIHRLHVAMDMIASEKTHAHMTFRPVEDRTITGVGTEDAATSANTWDVKSMWLQTEAAGIGIMAGKMQLTTNDKMILGFTGSSTGALVLSKTFNGITLTAADVIASEGTSTINDDVNVYMLGLSGKAGGLAYETNAYYMNIQEDDTSGFSPNVTSNQTGEGTTHNVDSDNQWLAATIGTEMGGIDITANLAYEAGFDNYDQIAAASQTGKTEQSEGSGFLVSARLNGNAGFGGWSAYGVYASEDFNTIQVDPDWSYMYDGMIADVGSTLLTFAATDPTVGSDMTSLNTSALENISALGAGLSIDAGQFTITPQIDYMAVTETEKTVNGTTYRSNIDDAWGGSIGLSTEIDAGTTFTVTAAMLDPKANKADADMPNGVGIDTMHSLAAELLIKF